MALWGGLYNGPDFRRPWSPITSRSIRPLQHIEFKSSASLLRGFFMEQALWPDLQLPPFAC